MVLPPAHKEKDPCASIEEGEDASRQVDALTPNQKFRLLASRLLSVTQADLQMLAKQRSKNR